MLKAKSRWQAFFIHLIISLIALLSLLAVIGFYWYPGIFIHMGGYQGIKIVTGVDLALGPLLTLMTYNPSKRPALIRMDLAIIFTIQFSALSAGMYLVYLERPLVQILSHDGLHVHSMSEFNTTNTGTGNLQRIPTDYPKVIYLDLPESKNEIKQLQVTTEFIQQKSITLRSDLYLDINNIEPQKLSSRLSHIKLDKTNDCYWLDLTSLHKTGKVCFHIRHGAILFE